MITKRTICRLAIALTLILPLAAFLVLFPPHEPLAVTGPHSVSTIRYSYVNKGRIEQNSAGGKERVVNVSFWYPQGDDDDETYPLVLFSHGGLGTETSNESLYLELASHGYVVGSIGHPRHSLWTKGDGGQITFVSREYFNELKWEDAKQDKERSYRYYQKWMATRTADINFALDTILEKAAAGEIGVYGLIDPSRIGVMGHSLGGAAALAIPRQRADVAAVIALESPFLYDITGVANGEFVWLDEAYPVPVLNIYSDAAWEHLTEWSQYGRNAALLASPQETTVSLHLPGAGHFSLTDFSLASPLLTRLLEGGQSTHDREGYLSEVNRACLDFFDRYLKGPDRDNHS